MKKIFNNILFAFFIITLCFTPFYLPCADPDTSIFIQAVQDNDIDKVKLLFSDKININQKNEKRNTAFFYAAYNSNIDMMKFLFEKKANPELDIPLHAVLLNDETKETEKIRSIEYLLSIGLNVNENNFRYNTILHIASEKGYINIVKFLLSNKADGLLKGHSNFRLTSIQTALLAGQYDVFKYFLDYYKIDITKDNSLLCSMIDLGHGEDDPRYNTAAKYLVNNGTPINKACKYGSSFHLPMYWAAFRHNAEIGKLLLEKGADPNVIDSWERTLTMLVARSEEDAELLKDLIQKGAPVNTKDKDGRTPLHYAIEYNNFEAIKILVENGCDINSQDNFGNTALMETVYPKGHIAGNKILNINEVVKYLLKYNAEVNVQNNDGQTALMFGCHTKEIVKQLLDKGADVSLKDNSGETAIDYANNYMDNEDVINTLKKYMKQK